MDSGRSRIEIQQLAVRQQLRYNYSYSDSDSSSGNSSSSSCLYELRQQWQTANRCIRSSVLMLPYIYMCVCVNAWYGRVYE